MGLKAGGGIDGEERNLREPGEKLIFRRVPGRSQNLKIESKIVKKRCIFESNWLILIFRALKCRPAETLAWDTLGVQSVIIYFAHYL